MDTFADQHDSHVIRAESCTIYPTGIDSGYIHRAPFEPTGSRLVVSSVCDRIDEEEKKPSKILVFDAAKRVFPKEFEISLYRQPSIFQSSIIASTPSRNKE